MSRYDTAIVGTGPAGLSAALTAKARNKDLILFGSAASSSKVRKAHRIANYLGLPNVSGEEMQRVFLAQIAQAGITITEEKVTLIYPMGNYFAIQAGTNLYEATTVILSAGMAPGRMLPGEEEFLGRGVSYCATCDAALYKGKTAVIIGYSQEAESEAEFLSEFADRVTYIHMYPKEPSFHAPIQTMRVKPLEITGQMKADTLHTDSGDLSADGFFILRESVAPGQLVPGLAMDEMHVAVDRHMATNIPGCFAAGDITGTPYQYIKAAGEGNVAMLSAVSYIDALKKNESADAGAASTLSE